MILYYFLLSLIILVIFSFDKFLLKSFHSFIDNLYYYTNHLSVNYQTFTRFVEVGRVVLINYGPDAGKLATIIDIIDQKRVLIDGPQKVTGIHRQPIGLKRLSLTDIVVSKLPRNATQKNLIKAWEEQSTLAAWNKTAWAKKIEAKTKRANTSDFDRFKIMVARKQKSKIISEAK